MVRDDPEGRIHNLSPHKFPRDTYRLLNKGLTYCLSSAHFNTAALKKDLQGFYRRIRLRAHFGNSDHTPSILDTLKERNTSYTPNEVDACILTFEAAMSRDLKDYLSQHYTRPTYRDNLSPNERRCLESLRSRDDLVITQADKGGAVVIWGIEEYLAEADNQLGNADYYCKLNQDPLEQYVDTISTTLEDSHKQNLIDKKTLTILKPVNTKSPWFYLLPEIHKPNNAGRPVISSTNCHTTKLQNMWITTSSP